MGLDGMEHREQHIEANTVFNLTDRLTIFSYLVSSNRVRWYRVIMRTFWHHHRELYRYQLTAQEVRDALREQLDPEYSLEQCQNDLVALKEWGCLTTIYDSSRATSIASFLSPALLYQATPEAMAIETFLAEQTRANASSGALRQGDLSRLWDMLLRIDEILQQDLAVLSASQCQELADEWQRAFEIWNTMAREAAQYLANMISASQSSKPDLEAYQHYKSAVVAYVHGFAQALTLYGPRIREQIAQWRERGTLESFVSLLAQYLNPPAPMPDQVRTEDELRLDAQKQVDALAAWFAPGKNADAFRRNALAEVDKVVRRAASLASASRPSANYAQQLHLLAHTLLQARDGETAQRLFSVAFAHPLPIHLSEGLAGTPSDLYMPDQMTAWQEEPVSTLYLRPVSRANRGEHTREDPIIDNRLLTQNLIEQHEARLQEQLRRLNHLFAQERLDIGTLKKVTAQERTILLDIIDSCLSQPSHQCRTLDDSVVVLLNPDEAEYTLLKASDGVLLLPRYCLERRMMLALAAVSTRDSKERKGEDVDR
ncbi:TIGR02677 family protein [Dictyobacter formicarum]|uniref:TIGR02677 family protein n=1 Tax=Dictyobacter formicarum TaxID=2778368 RepID=A0ABQ3VFD4_9CHLR|nr:TIGR02677 family protein [Dictyobacter formicarum]GHO84093.1 TIGR02677 family protein [Dictyobacter formicarum]